MKKLLVNLMAMAVCSCGYALPLGNPIEASLFTDSLWSDVGVANPCDPCFDICNCWNVRIGFYGEYVFNRHMELCSGSSADIDTVELYTNAGYFALNICERVDFFTTLGVTNLSFANDLSPFTSDPAVARASRFSFIPEFSWSVGARATLWQCDCFGLGIEGQYFSTSPDFNYLLQEANGSLTYLDGHHVCYSEWQVGLGFSYSYRLYCAKLALIPYIGITWAKSRLDMRDLSFQLGGQDVVIRDLCSEKWLGFAYGTTFSLAHMIAITVEGRFADEKAVYVNGEFRF